MPEWKENSDGKKTGRNDADHDGKEQRARRQAAPSLDPEGKTLAKHKRETFDIVDTPVDPLR